MKGKGKGKNNVSGYNLAYKCLHCEGFRWADTAEARGETHCLCGRAFPRKPVRMPFYRKGPPSTPKREGASQALDATSSPTVAAAAAKANPGAKPKAKPPTPAPWAPSPTGRRCDDAAAELHLDPKRVDDELYMIESFAKVAKHFKKTEMMDQLETSRRQALRARAENMPPKQRLDHLRKRHKEALAELKRLNQVKDATENEINMLKARCREESKAAEAQRELIEEVRKAIEEAELDMPPTERPRPVGPQDPKIALKEALKTTAIPIILDVLSDRYDKEFGAAISEEQVCGRRTRMALDMLQSAHDELQAEREVHQRQVDEDAKVARRLHLKLNPQEVQQGDKRGREVDLDRGGDERMGVQNADRDDDAGWQIAKGSKKGKGITLSPIIPGIPIPVGPIGPLATAPRASQASSSSGRHHLQERPSASGTPAKATASGSLQTSGEKETPVVRATTSAAPQPSEQSQDEPETPCLDSLPSTPREADKGNTEDETPCPYAGLTGDPTKDPMEQDAATGDEPTPGAPASITAAAAQPVGCGASN